MMSVMSADEPTQFRKLPVVITAAQWTRREQAGTLVDWSEGAVSYTYDVAGPSDPETGQDWGLLEVASLEGIMTAAPRDWIIRGVNGEFYPCKPDVFLKTYEKLRGAM